MNLDAFINLYEGTQITDNHGNYWGECVSFVKRYAQEVQGVPNADSVLYVKGDLAKNMYLDPNPPSLEYYDLVASNPQRGDIVVYGNPNDGSYGDVAVALGNGKVIGQLGFPVYHPVAIRDIGSPLGYLRRKGGGNNMFPNDGDLDNFAGRTNWPGHPLNANDRAYWTQGTGNPSWASGADNVWKDLIYEVTLYVLNHPNTAPTPTAIKLDKGLYKVE